MIFIALLPIPWASYQCSSALRRVPFGRRTVAIPFSLRQRQALPDNESWPVGTLIQFGKLSTALEQNVGGKLALSGDPIMLGVLKDIVHLRRHQIGVLAEDFGPVEIGESLGEFLRARWIFDPSSLSV